MRSLHTVVIGAAWLVVASAAPAAPAEEAELVARINQLVAEHFPDAVVAQDNGKYTAKHGTIVCTVHGRSLTGRVSAQRYEKEGPNYKGFMISISVAKGRYDGQTSVPQTLNQLYWKTYFTCPSTRDGKRHYVIKFSFGSRLDNDFKKAVFEALPKARAFGEPAAAGKQ
ncbi:MAG: hypothetical protein HN849_28905 [Victivallales bacterium]|jgi:hypothetical protein|nr:hypothetical protein [Victivallales bacterium]MBT7303583.1 hypothetical protein [Victivallales bacterium]